MVGTSKILTVSYGTFSCTLEGFDDSFNTMKAIAEYFRGLAADDRYFGAEPPTPDAEMLARIAEREIARRVDARQDDSGIVLRAAALAEGETQSSKDVDDAEAQRAAEEAEAQAKADAEAEAEAEAQRLADEAEAQRAAEEAEAQRAAEEAEAQAKADAEAEAEAQRLADEAEAQRAAEEAEAQAKAEAEAEAEAQRLADEAEAQRAAEEAEAEAQRLADEAEAQAKADAEAEAEAQRLADEAEAQAKADAEAEAEAQRLADEAEAQAEAQRAEEAAKAAAAATPDTESVAAKLQRIRAVVGVADNDPSNDLTEDVFASSENDLTDAETLVEDFDAHAAELEAEDSAPESTEIEADTTSGGDMIARVMAHQSNDDADDAPATEVEANTADNPDLGMLDGADELDAYLEDDDMDMGDVDVSDLDLDLEETAEDNVAALMDDETDSVPAEDVAPEATENRAFLTQEPQVDEDALDRLMSETDAQLQEPEGTRRRNAIAQLKAAVASKEAARQVGEPDADGQDVENAFRNDLSDAVSTDPAPRPRPVVRNSENRTERPKAAPLKLVAAQRVDSAPETQPRDTPVRPRRVEAQQAEARAQEAGSFAEFAEQMGAKELPELLEAAAAYTSFVEGAGEFSRPQILRQVRAVADTAFNREDGLRSFADLLRAGRFTKIRNGRFQVADDTRFKPERQAS